MARHQDPPALPLDGLPEDFGRWMRNELEHPGDVAAMVRDVRALLEVKARVLESPDPVQWTEELIVELVTDAAPRELDDTPAQEESTRDRSKQLALSLRFFIGFLRATGRWPDRGLEIYKAEHLLAQLAWPDPEDWAEVSVPLPPG